MSFTTLQIPKGKTIQSWADELINITGALKDDKPRYTIDRGFKVDEGDLKETERIVFSELSNKGTPDQQKQEARNIINTALNRVPKMKKTLTSVLQQPNQYQGYKTKQYNLAATGNLDYLGDAKMKLVKSVVDEMRSGNFPDTTGGAVFYRHDKNGNLILDNKRKLFK